MQLTDLTFDGKNLGAGEPEAVGVGVGRQAAQGEACGGSPKRPPADPTAKASHSF